MRRYITVLFLLLASMVNAADSDSIFAGHYVWGHEVHSFTPCDGNVSYWVSFDWPGLAMQNYYRNNFKTPYQPMYLKFRGHILDEQVDGFAEQYDGLIRISEVKAYSFKRPDHCK